MSSFYRYIRTEKDRVQGWFARIDSQIFYEVLRQQNALAINGAVAEIGVHHGKSFIALCRGLVGDQKAYAIDLFEQQDKNKDASGHGDRDIFLHHLEQFDVPQSQVVIDARSSDEVKSADIFNAVGGVRFFSIDGGHWREIVKSDLLLASSLLVEGGVIALDDFMRSEWPDVSIGFFDWMESSSMQIVPFAIGFNKLYLCQRDYVSKFQKCLSDSQFLPYFLNKDYEFYGIKVPVFQFNVLPDRPLLRRWYEHLKLFYPSTFVMIHKQPIVKRLLRHAVKRLPPHVAKRLLPHG